jgi:hypothetical protein
MQFVRAAILTLAVFGVAPAFGGTPAFNADAADSTTQATPAETPQTTPIETPATPAETQQATPAEPQQNANPATTEVLPARHQNWKR